MAATLAFSLVLDRAPSGEDLIRLFTAGCDDAAFGRDGGVAVADFDRSAATLADAIVSATQAVETAGLLPLRVAGQAYVTLADIADRAGMGADVLLRHALSGDFPVPVGPAGPGTVLYRWSEVAAWLRARLDADVTESDPTLLMAGLLIQARRLLPQVADAGVLGRLLVT